MKSHDPADLMNAAQRAALEEVKKAAKQTFPLAVAAPAPDNSGDFILVGKHPMGLASCAIRLNQIQALMLCSQMSGMIGQAALAAQQQNAKLVRRNEILEETMEAIEAVSFTLTVKTNTREVVKTGTSYRELVDALDDLYDESLCPINGDMDDDDPDFWDIGDEVEEVLDDVYDEPPTPRGFEPPIDGE